MKVSDIGEAVTLEVRKLEVGTLGWPGVPLGLLQRQLLPPPAWTGRGRVDCVEETGPFSVYSLVRLPSSAVHSL